MTLLREHCSHWLRVGGPIRVQAADLCTRVGFGDDRSDNVTELSGVSWLSVCHQPSSIYEGFLVNKWSTFTGDAGCDRLTGRIL